MSQIISVQTNQRDIDVNKDFAHYKFAIPEHEPIRLSNGTWLHTYRVTKYNDLSPIGDDDVEQRFFDEEMFS
jgi:hypothetical protein